MQKGMAPIIILTILAVMIIGGYGLYRTKINNTLTPSPNPIASPTTSTQPTPSASKSTSGTPSPTPTSSSSPAQATATTTAPTPFPTSTRTPSPTARPTTNPTTSPTNQSIKLKVLLLIYNPTLESQNNQKLTSYKNWNDPEQLTNQFISSVREASGGYTNYEIAEKIEVDGYPQKSDGFTYSDETYLDCAASGGSRCHNPDLADYQKMIADSGACEKRNSGAIDELWIWGGPWFGYWESNLAGLGAFWYNSSPTMGTTCNKLLPIMGFNYQVGVDLMLHDMGHRLESTMARVYGGAAGNPSNPWYKFSRTEGEFAGNGGCGKTHWPVNTLIFDPPHEYIYNSTTTVSSTCEDFKNYPNLTGAKQIINCSAWGCNQQGYFEWMFSRLPKASGTSADGKLNNWWKYLIDPQSTL